MPSCPLVPALTLSAVVILAAAVVAARPAHATTRPVPELNPTIQDAIDHSVAGDTVLRKRSILGAFPSTPCLI